MRFLLFIALSITWVCSVTGRPTDIAVSSVTQLQERGIPYCLFPSRRTSSTSFTTSFTSNPIGWARTFSTPPYERAGNSQLTYRVYELSRGISALDTVLDVAPPDGHAALGNYEIEVRRIPNATPNAAGECFQTATLTTGQRGPATLRWRLDAGYTYYLTISEI